MELFAEKNLYTGLAATAVLVGGVVIALVLGYSSNRDKARSLEEDKRKEYSSLENKTQENSDRN